MAQPTLQKKLSELMLAFSRTAEQLSPTFRLGEQEIQIEFKEVSRDRVEIHLVSKPEPLLRQGPEAPLVLKRA